MSANVQSLTLANGLRVSLCSAPRLKRCAAALRVLAGSHDVPAQWPGLAHFLEHLFFLGTERFPADEKLMTFVQRRGGQLNASTRERTTDFFFELPQPAFADGLERLCDMLVHPRMALDDQLREREVLHAEFIAWSRDDASRAQSKLLAPVSVKHPLRRFHAGNRFSLPVPRKAFQQALKDFYRQFYKAGQMTLSLAGPQSLAELEALATRLGAAFVSGSNVEQLKPPPLLDQPREAFTTDETWRMHLTFACEGLPGSTSQAADFFCTWLNNAQSGGLIAELRDRGLIESLKGEVLYEFGGQVLLDIDIGLSNNITDKHASDGGTQSAVGAHLPSITSDSSKQKQLICALFFNWLDFFKSRYPEQLNEYALLQKRRLAISGALVLARHFSDEQAMTELPAHSVDALLNQLKPSALLRPQHHSPADNIAWRLPEPNPFLRPVAHSDEGAVYLRWTLPGPQPKLHQMLSASLKSLTADAQQAGVTLGFTAYGNYWQLKLAGLCEVIPVIAEHALRLLSQPNRQTLARYGQLPDEPAPIPIRQLLTTLPDHFLNSSYATETSDLATAWTSAKWQHFVSGIAEGNQQALIGALSSTPGKPFDKNLPALQPTTGKRWQAEPSDASEAALLLFCPAPSMSVQDEAIWRLFAHLIQAPFYQRLRVELQLGYAVFSGLRQIAGQTGLLFGVQSPTATAEQLATHIENVINKLPELISRTDVPQALQALSAQLDPQTMDPQQGAEMLWQAHLAGHGLDYVERLQHSLATLDQQTLSDAADQLVHGASTRLYLANRCNPGMR